MQRSMTFVCASALMLAFAAPSFAQSSQNRVVEYGDVDAYSQRGAETILNRVEHASEQICGDRPGPMPIPERQGVAACTYETMDIAVADINNPAVTARYYGYDPQVIVEDPDDAYLSPKGNY